MEWGARRRVIIGTIVGGIVLLIIAVTSEAIFYHVPSCSDNIQNQGETGVDCGGPCPYLCSDQQAAPVVRFTQALHPVPGRVDIIAYIDNPNQSAAANVPYSVTLYGGSGVLMRSSGLIDLPAGTTVPLYIPSFYFGSASTTNAFVTIDTSQLSWVAASKPVMPSVSNVTLGGTTGNPRITATLSNPSTVPFDNVKIIATVFDSANNVIAASQTIASSIEGEGSTQVTFSWNAPLSATPARIEVYPLSSLAP